MILFLNNGFYTLSYILATCSLIRVVSNIVVHIFSMNLLIFRLLRYVLAISSYQLCLYSYISLFHLSLYHYHTISIELRSGLNTILINLYLVSQDFNMDSKLCMKCPVLFAGSWHFNIELHFTTIIPTT